MMDQWNEKGDGGGYFNEAETPGSQAKTKAATRQQFLCPVTIRQLLEAPEDGLKVGAFTAAMVTVVGIAVNVEKSSTKVKFTISDDTGIIDCFDWLDSEDAEEPKASLNILENTYYQVYGCIKTAQGQRHIMVFKVVPITDFNDYTAFMAEVLSVNIYAQKMNQGGNDMQMETNTATTVGAYNTGTTYDDFGTPFTPVQKAVLDAIKAVNTQIGWAKNDPVLKSKFSVKQIDDALDFLVGEGHIYSTVDDDHYSST